MRTTRLALALAAPAVLLAGTSGTAATALPVEAAPVLCPAQVPSSTEPGTFRSNPSTTVETGTSNAAYDATTTTLPAPEPTGKVKKKDPPPAPVTVTSGVFGTQFTLEDATCAGASYSVTVTSTDGSPLGWSTTRTSAADADGATTSATAPTTVSPDGSSATTTFTGDGAAHGFELAGATDGYTASCVVATLRITGPSGDERFVKGLEVCDDLPGGTSYR